MGAAGRVTDDEQQKTKRGSGRCNHCGKKTEATVCDDCRCSRCRRIVQLCECDGQEDERIRLNEKYIDAVRSARKDDIVDVLRRAREEQKNGRVD